MDRKFPLPPIFKDSAEALKVEAHKQFEKNILIYISSSERLKQ